MCSPLMCWFSSPLLSTTTIFFFFFIFFFSFSSSWWSGQRISKNRPHSSSHCVRRQGCAVGAQKLRLRLLDF
jgi:hypothetical protein